ncbi:MAG: septal ring lytic transglycosylase RlpA family protein [Rhizobiales bacterium]|nr:septal ring lytic transglycosylase RlpA family protein [Hyphomicrobiales bacterium]
MKKTMFILFAGSLIYGAGVADLAQSKTLKGYASFYKHGSLTANGERFNPMGMTAAHRSLPFGTKVKVTNMRTGKTVVVRINDRGPFINGRVIDLSLGAAQRVGMIKSGVAKVNVVVVD